MKWHWAAAALFLGVMGNGVVQLSMPLFLTGMLGVISTTLAAQSRRPSGDLAMANVITDEQKLDFAFVPKTAAGNPAHIDDIPVWQVSDPSILDLAVAEDGLTATVISLGPLGSCQLSVQADADMGEGTRLLTATAEILVVPAEAATIGLVAGVPVLR